MVPPNRAERASNRGVTPTISANGPSCPSRGVARAMLVPTVTAQMAS